jgi:hypothetical protein
MARVTNPITLSGHFNIDPATLDKLGVLDFTLAIDTKLFIDPLLLRSSKQKEFSGQASNDYHNFFVTIIKLLTSSKFKGDVAWKAAEKMFTFHEIKGTCLGYGAGSIRGSGFGEKLTKRILDVASQIVSIGVDDPDLFSALALFEEDIGPDRISDMATNIIQNAIASFNARILTELKLKAENFPNGKFLKNPFEPSRTPVILLPRDILRDLPIANDWDGVAASARRNQELRDRLNKHVSSIWRIKSKRLKSDLKSDALSSKEAFMALLESIKTVPISPYDFIADPEGLVNWSSAGKYYADKFPLQLKKGGSPDLDTLYKIVKKIVEQFRHLIEHLGLNKELFKDSVFAHPKHESTAQRLFFSVAYVYCKSNNIDISPEIDTGNGKIDFKFSAGFDKRVLVEIKLSTNSKLVTGYTTQLEIYKKSCETMRALYLVIDVGRMGKKDQELLKLKNAASQRKDPPSDIEFVDGKVKLSASKRLAT